MLATGGKLLVVDDEAGLRRSLHIGLAQRGWGIDEVEEGLPALALIEASYLEGHPYRAVIADINLPDISGLKLLDLIKSGHPSMPVIVISAYGTASTPDLVRQRRGAAFLSKPFLVDELTKVVDHLPPYEEGPAATPPLGVQRVTISAYAFVRFRPNADWMAAFQRFYFMDHVIYCDAVHEVFDVVLLLNGESQAELEALVAMRIRALPDVEEVILSPIVRPNLDPKVQAFIDSDMHRRALEPGTNRTAQASTALSTYLLVSIEQGRAREVLPRLYFMRGVVSCDATQGEYDAVVLVQSHSFDENQRIFNEELRRIDGIVRTRSLKIINLYEM